jgi:tetracycline 7-halogenase / FADH2 O2-dependent halogenase
VEAKLNCDFDIAVVGSGFAGSLMAMIALRLGRSVVLIDKGRHPRMMIGESSTPLANLLLEELADRYDLPLVRPLAKWGSWQQSYPEVACGLKRGFTFFPHDLHRPDGSPPARDRQLLVAASPNNSVADTHWYRADFDYLLLRQAQAMGAEYFDQTDLNALSFAADGVSLRGRRDGADLAISARFVIDASGPRGFLYRHLGLAEDRLPGYPGTQAIYSHFTGVARLSSLDFGATATSPPFPVDDAAVHHLFDGGWIWVLQFNNGITSAGIAATDEKAAELNFGLGEQAWQRILAQIPALQEQFARAKASVPFNQISRLSFLSSAIAGDRWAMLPSAAGFVDPLLSTGFPLTLLGIARMAKILEEHWDSDRRPRELATYAAHTKDELVAASQLIAALYANMNDFSVFSTLSLLYFAAASYAEVVRRLGKPHLAASFLLHDDPRFGPASRGLLRRAVAKRSKNESDALVADILNFIAPFNIAELGDPTRENWYPVHAEDLFRAAAKVDATPEDIAQMLSRCGFELPSATPDEAVHRS